MPGFFNQEADRRKKAYYMSGSSSPHRSMEQIEGWEKTSTRMDMVIGH